MKSKRIDLFLFTTFQKLFPLSLSQTFQPKLSGECQSQRRSVARNSRLGIKFSPPPVERVRGSRFVRAFIHPRWKILVPTLYNAIIQGPPFTVEKASLRSSLIVCNSQLLNQARPPALCNRLCSNASNNFS